MRRCPVCSSTKTTRECDLLLCAICSAFIGEAPMNIDKMRIKAVNRLVELGWTFSDNEWHNPQKTGSSVAQKAGQLIVPGAPTPPAQLNPNNPYELAFKQVYKAFEDYNQRDPRRTIMYIDLYNWVVAIKNTFNITF